MKSKLFKNFVLRKINKRDLKKLLLLRNQKKIRKSMINNKKISKKEHLNWFVKLTKSKFFHVYAFVYKKKIIGSGYASNYQIKDKYCYWGIYRDLELPKDKKYGSILLFLLFEKLFSIKKISHLRCQVIKKNIWVKNWYKSWGYKHLYFDKKNNCHVLKMTKKEWKNKKNYILKNKLSKTL